MFWLLLLILIIKMKRSKEGGLGFETAKSLAQAGATVLVHTRKAQQSEETAAKIRALLGNQGAQVEPVVADLGDLEDVSKMAKHVLSKHKVSKGFSLFVFD